MPPKHQKAAPKPLDSARLEELALHYAARFATSRAKLSDYLTRKLRERGWAGESTPDIGALIERLAELRYVDDNAFAAMRGTALTRRGYGPRRVAQALDAAGIAGEDLGEALDRSRRESWRAADTFARKRRIGPYAERKVEREGRQKQIAAFVRAGHDFATAALWVDAAPGEPPPGPDGEELF
ncbi:MAG TPA: RecX family transcriptional regulator [Sphingobium sp.]|uniref:regulatory protein RecX n=1 Tax=Sphingobium sp. TaxID=1912891 RepID=UPI002ECFEAB3